MMGPTEPVQDFLVWRGWTGVDRGIIVRVFVSYGVYRLWVVRLPRASANALELR